MNDNHLMDPRLVNLLESLRETEPRDPHRAALYRSSFLSEAANTAKGVSQAPFQRLNKWKAAFQNFFTVPRKESKPMFRIAIALIVLVGFVFGGSSVAIAQSSLPDEPLYPVKIWTEEFRFSLAGNEQTRFNLTWDFANRRIDEIQTLLMEGSTIPEPVINRLETQLEGALVHAVNLPEEGTQAALLQVQTQLQLEEQAMSQFRFQTEATPPMIQTRDRLRNMLEIHLGLAQGGLEDPQWLREQLQTRKQERSNRSGTGGGNPWTTGTPTPGSGYGPGEPQNPWTTGTPTPGSGYGPGGSQNPWTTGTPMPGSGYGPGEPQNPWATGTPTPGSSYGPGPGHKDLTPSSKGPGPCDFCGGNPGGNGNKP